MNRINFEDYAIKLSRGSHNSPQEGLCVMEAVCYIMGEEKFTDRPQCACPVITNLAIDINDSALRQERNRLLPYVLRIAGSKASWLIEQQRRNILDIFYEQYRGWAFVPMDKCLAVLDELLVLTEQVEPTPAIQEKLVELTVITA